MRGAILKVLGTILLCAVSWTACQSESMLTESTHSPTATPWIITATPGPTSTPWIVTPTPRPTAGPTATATPQAQFIPPTPSGPGICGRTPEVQDAIIEQLKLRSCQLITEPELFRIRALGIKGVDLKAGDFAGLLNLESLKVVLSRSRYSPSDGQLSAIPAGTFTDSRIADLRIGESSANSHPVTIEDGAFDGAHVESLSIHLAVGSRLGQLPSRLPESVKHLSVIADLRTLDWTVFQTLPMLESLTMTHKDVPENGSYDDVYIDIPVGAFAGNPMLILLGLRDSGSGNRATYRVGVGLMAKHEHLAHVDIQRLSLRGPQPDGVPIRLHPDSPAADYVAEQGTREWSGWENGHSFRIGS